VVAERPAEDRVQAAVRLVAGDREVDRVAVGARGARGDDTAVGLECETVDPLAAAEVAHHDAVAAEAPVEAPTVRLVTHEGEVVPVARVAADHDPAVRL
jgi:hypothetical protein